LFHVNRPDIEKIQEISGDHHPSTYRAGDRVALKSARIDLHNSSTGINSTPLQVACPPPGIGKFEIFLFAESARMELEVSAKES
jgi:hypothetical protein